MHTKHSLVYSYCLQQIARLAPAAAAVEPPSAASTADAAV
jgi:hypothetical protein